MKYWRELRTGPTAGGLPSADACQTTEAALNPDCGRASAWSSTMTAIGCRAASAGVTRSPLSGAGTSTGVGIGVAAAAGGGERAGRDEAQEDQADDPSSHALGRIPR